MQKPLIILDRDGVINKLLTHGLIVDSPMSISEIEVFPWVPDTLKLLNDSGFKLVIASNQPAWAKGKISFQDLNAIHEHIVIIAQSMGATILSSHLCYHKSQDGCFCRKPQNGLLLEALKLHKCHPNNAWMVGDKYTDILAGKSLGLKTALLSTSNVELQQCNSLPDFFGSSLLEFLCFLLKTYHISDAL